MKYTSTDRLQDFEFHDSYITFESCNNGELIVSIAHLNIHKTAEQNEYETDMEIDQARITFRGFSVRTIKYQSGYTTDESENKYTVFDNSEAEEKLISEIKGGFYMLWFGLLDNGLHGIEGTKECPALFFDAEFSFSSATVEWDKYCKMAWYEENKSEIQNQKP